MSMKESRTDFDGDGKDDVLVFRSTDGYVGKWYSDTPRSPVFSYETAQYIGGSPGAFPGAQLLVGDFDGDCGCRKLTPPGDIRESRPRRDPAAGRGSGPGR